MACIYSPITDPIIMETVPLKRKFIPLAEGIFSSGTNLGIITDWKTARIPLARPIKAQHANTDT